MRQAVMVSPGSIELREAASPAPGRGQVLLRIHRIGVCGSDVHVYHGKHPFTPYPVVQGHEFAATVEAVGEGVTAVAPGAHVTATPQETCGMCGPCRRGQYNVCENLKVRGFQAPGVAQDLFVTEADKLVPLPENFTWEQGAFVEPVAVAAHATLRVANLPGSNVVVLGAGPIGNLVAQGCTARGARNVLITDVSDYRLEVARKVGVAHTARVGHESLSDAVARAFAGEGVQVAFECAGSETALAEAIGMLEKGGVLVSVGVFSAPPRIDMAAVCEHELSVIGTMMYRHEDYTQAVRWMAGGHVRTEPLDSRHFAFEDYLDAYRFIDAQGDRCVKVFIDL